MTRAVTIETREGRRNAQTPSRMVSALLVHVAGPLACGALLYIGVRPGNVGLFDWLTRAGLQEILITYRQLLLPARDQLPQWVVYSLPDGLWCYAATAAALAIWRDTDPSPISRVLPHAGFLCACGLELLQLCGVIAGRADPVDVLLSWVGYVSAVRALSRSCHEDPACVPVRY